MPPRPKPRQRRGGKGGGTPAETGPRRPRAATLRKGSTLRDLPELGAAAPLAGWLIEAGPITWDGWGSPHALTWQELDAWQRLTGTPLTHRQLRVLHLLSQEYAASAAAALEPDCPAPDAPRANPATVADQVRAAMAALGAKAAPSP